MGQTCQIFQINGIFNRLHILKKAAGLPVKFNLAVHHYEYLQTSQLYMDFTSASCHFESLAR